MTNRGFVFQAPNYCWDLIEWLARDIYELEMYLSVIPPSPTYITPPRYCSNCQFTSHGNLSCDVILVNDFTPTQI